MLPTKSKLQKLIDYAPHKIKFYNKSWELDYNCVIYKMKDKTKGKKKKQRHVT